MESLDSGDPITSADLQRDDNASITEISTVAAMFFIVGIGFVTMAIVLSPTGQGILMPYLITGLSLLCVSFALPLAEGMCSCCNSDTYRLPMINYSDTSTPMTSTIYSSGPSRSWCLGGTSSETVNETILTIPLSVPVRSSCPNGETEMDMKTSSSDSYARTIATSAQPGACTPNDKSRLNKLAHTTVDRASSMSTRDDIVTSSGDTYPGNDDATSSNGVLQTTIGVTTCHGENQTTRKRAISGAITSHRRTKQGECVTIVASTIAEVISKMRSNHTPGCATLVKILDHCMLRTFRTPQANCLTSQDNIISSYFARARRRNHNPSSRSTMHPPATRNRR